MTQLIFYVMYVHTVGFGPRLGISEALDTTCSWPLYGGSSVGQGTGSLSMTLERLLKLSECFCNALCFTSSSLDPLQRQGAGPAILIEEPG
jgi:hypothetical protein